jgi:acyl-CoA dehydrogenase
MNAASQQDVAFLDGIRRIAQEVAAGHADDVDKAARFPFEAVAALKEERALSALIPTELGGDGVSFEAIAEGCMELGRTCAATSMVFAMHQIEVATMLRHTDGSPWFENYLTDVAEGQRLIASVTSEIGTGGDVGSSIAAVEQGASGMLTFEKQAPTVSYGAHADDFFTTLRRSPDAEPSDQVIVLTRKEQTTLDPMGIWEPLGMRGTCSPGFVVRAEFAPEQILPGPFAQISAESMLPITHVLWTHVWLGIANDAFDRARAFVRAAARRDPGKPLPSATRLSHLLSDLTLLRSEVRCGLEDFTRADREDLASLSYALRFNNLKIAVSEQAPLVCQGALAVCGIAGYRNDTPYSIGRNLRDSMSACLMIANERIHATNASLLLLAKDV